jgi:hypothetical protein
VFGESKLYGAPTIGEQHIRPELGEEASIGEEPARKRPA